MSEKTAYLVEENVGGWPGRANLYRISHPMSAFDGRHETEYVIVYVVPPAKHTYAQCKVVPAHESGGCLEASVRHREGSFTPHGDPFQDEAHLRGCYDWALAMAGYQRVDAPTPEPEPEPEPEFPNGLDYDPDVLPE